MQKLLNDKIFNTFVKTLLFPDETVVFGTCAKGTGLISWESL